MNYLGEFKKACGEGGDGKEEENVLHSNDSVARLGGLFLYLSVANTRWISGRCLNPVMRGDGMIYSLCLVSSCSLMVRG